AVSSAWPRSSLTGWTVSLGVPAEPVEAALRSSLIMLGSVGLVVMLATVLVALHIGRRLAGSMAEATESAMALAKGEPLLPLESGVVELHVLGEALERAGRTLVNEAAGRPTARHA